MSPSTHTCWRTTRRNKNMCGKWPFDVDLRLKSKPSVTQSEWIRRTMRTLLSLKLSLLMKTWANTEKRNHDYWEQGKCWNVYNFTNKFSFCWFLLFLISVHSSRVKKFLACLFHSNRSLKKNIDSDEHMVLLKHQNLFFKHQTGHLFPTVLWRSAMFYVGVHE